MAELRATFQADFSSFQDASAKAEVSLKAMETGADKTGVAIDKMTKSLDGTKIKQQADVASIAVEKIGGTAELTDKELQKIGRTADEAIAKYKRLGEEVPAHLQKLSDAAHDAEKNTGAIGRIAEFVGPQLLAMFSVGAVTAWVSSTVDAASHIEDLSRKLDVSHEAIQRWGYAADLSGATIDDVSQALGFMNKTLGGGSDSTIAALKKAGLAFDEIRQLKPEDAFDVITEAIKNIPDPMDQARVATELLGKGAAAILPAIRDGFREVGAEAKVMSDATIEALDNAGDAWTRLKNKVVIASGGIIAAAFKAFDNPLGDRDIHKAIDDETAALDRSLSHLADAANKTYKQSFVPAVNDADKALAAFNLTNADNEKKLKIAIEAHDEHTKRIKELANVLTGQAVAQKAKDLGEALKLAGGAAHLTADQTEEFYKAADTLVKGPLGSSALPANVKALWQENSKLALGINNDVNPSLDRFYDHLYGIDKALPELKLKTVAFLNTTSTNVLAAWKADEKAGTDAAKEIERQHKESLKAIEDRHNQFVQTMVGYGVTLIDGLTHGWDSFKSAALSVAEEILRYFEKVFVVKMLEYFGLMQIGGTGAFAGLANASATSAAQILAGQQAAAAGTSAAWLTTLSQISVWAGSTALVFGGLIKLISSYNYGPTPNPPSSGGGPGGPGGTDDDNLNYAQSLFDFANAYNLPESWKSFQDFMAHHGNLWGMGNGFRGGTHGQYVDFGAGTPVMLHGRERVMTQAEGAQSGGAGWGPPIIVQTLDSADFVSFLRRGGARDIADALGPHLARVLA